MSHMSSEHSCSTLSDLALPHAYCEVVDKDANAVLDEIEAIMLRMAATIMQVRDAVFRVCLLPTLIVGQNRINASYIW